MSFLDTHKDLHIKITKPAHVALRALMFKKELSMQELFEEFVQLIVSEDPRTARIIEQLVVKKAQAKLDKVKKQPSMSELDQDTLYNLLENQSPLGTGEEEEEDK
jgi:23S rRNA maturation-related 3'-5' exoribonuclease YhaM